MNNKFNSISDVDIEAFVSSIKHRDQVAKQLAEVSNNYSIDSVSLPNFFVSKLSLGKMTMFHGVTEKNHTALSVLLTESSLRVNGVELPENALYVMPSMKENLSLYRHEASCFYVSASDDYLSKSLGEKTFFKLKRLGLSIAGGRPMVSSSKMSVFAVAKQIENAMHNLSNLSPLTLRDIEGNISSSIIDLVNESADPVSIPYNKRMAIVSRAIEYFNSVDNIYISISDVCRECYCSIRTLEYAFNQVLGVTPKQYLNFRKVQKIRRDLIEGRFDSIGNLMKHYGVVNPGRFSRDYYSIFGEFPKQTISKSLNKL